MHLPPDAKFTSLPFQIETAKITIWTTTKPAESKPGAANSTQSENGSKSAHKPPDSGRKSSLKEEAMPISG